MDRHLNLFYSYRTAHIEDNVTRALLITLRSISPFLVRELFSEIIPNDIQRKSKFDIHAEPEFEFDLQIAASQQDDGKLNADNGVLLGLTYSGDQGVDFGSEKFEGASRPDARITDVGNELSLIIESKKGDHQTEAQLNRHFGNFFDTETTKIDDVYVEVRWHDIAERLSRLRKMSNASQDQYFISQFIEYLDRLHLIDFLGFRKDDFTSGNTEKLHRFLSLAVKRLSEEDLGDLKPYERNQQIHFKSLPDNIYVHYDGDKLVVGSVCGSGNKTRAQRLRQCLESSPERVRSLLDSLKDETQDILGPSIRISLILKIHSYVHYSRFRRKWLGNIRGPFKYPDEVDEFRRSFIDPEVNTFEWLEKSTLTERFWDQISEAGHELDSNDLFPKWEDVDQALQYCYFHVDVDVPRHVLVGKQANDVVRIFGEILKCHRRFLEGLPSS